MVSVYGRVVVEMMKGTWFEHRVELGREIHATYLKENWQVNLVLVFLLDFRLSSVIIRC